MGRELRAVEPHGYYHLVARGNNRQDVFDSVVRPLFIHRLGLISSRFDWNVFGWALMDNHFHLIVQIGDSGLSEGMCRLDHWLANVSNARFGRINHCLGQRFWSVRLETEEHFLASLRYALWNPARAGVGMHPSHSSWSSFRASVGLDAVPAALSLARLHEHFSPRPERARRQLRQFIWEGRERCQEPWRDGAGILT